MTHEKNFTPEQDRERTNVHYMLPARFFEVLTGGAWHTYSCNLWGDERPRIESDEEQTRSQERKLDLFATMIGLRPGMRILDVGSGWGGPLVYLSKRYGVTGVGLTLSERQLEYASAWAAREGADCRFVLSHWDRYEADAPFDAVMTDEVIVHFFRLDDFFAKAFAMLRDGGVMLNKELHYGHSAFVEHQPEGARFVDALYGGTANYRPLAEELAMVDRAGFVVEEIRQLDASHYAATALAWRGNLRRNQRELEELVGKDVFRSYMVYLRLVAGLFAERTPAEPYRRQELHVVKCRKLPAALRKDWGIASPARATVRRI